MVGSKEEPLEGVRLGSSKQIESGMFLVHGWWDNLGAAVGRLKGMEEEGSSAARKEKVGELRSSLAH
jgi:hypothetical protein